MAYVGMAAGQDCAASYLTPHLFTAADGSAGPQVVCSPKPNFISNSNLIDWSIGWNTAQLPAAFTTSGFTGGPATDGGGSSSSPGPGSSYYSSGYGRLHDGLAPTPAYAPLIYLSGGVAGLQLTVSVPPNAPPALSVAFRVESAANVVPACTAPAVPLLYSCLTNLTQAATNHDGWLLNLEGAVSSVRDHFGASTACLSAVYEGGLAYVALAACGPGADDFAPGVPHSVAGDPAASVPLLLAAQPPPQLQPLLQLQPPRLRHGLRHFVCVPLCSGEVVVGVLTLAAREGAAPPPSWRSAGVLGAVGAALALLLAPPQVGIVCSVLSDVHAARNVEELVRAARRGVADLVVATSHLQPTLRVALEAKTFPRDIVVSRGSRAVHSIVLLRAVALEVEQMLKGVEGAAMGGFSTAAITSTGLATNGPYSPNACPVAVAIGEGGYGEVYRGMYDGMEVAIKIVYEPLRDKDAPPSTALPRVLTFFTDVYVHAAMASNGSAAAHAVAGSPPAMVICMEYCDMGNLTDAIIRGAFRQPTIGLYGSSAPNMKLKPTNILLRSSPRDPRDFGLVRLMEPCGPEGQLAVPTGVTSGTVTHMAPEVLAKERATPHDSALDVYAFGIIMWQMACGGRLYPGVDHEDIPRRVVREGMRPRFTSSVPGEYRALAERCWAANPASRPAATELVTSLKKLMGLEPRLGGGGGQRRYSALAPLMWGAALSGAESEACAATY
eukprot:XP_001702858.1 serine/threonine protein kinase 14 [Chlamydomonas reinhardtii]